MSSLLPWENPYSLFALAGSAYLTYETWVPMLYRQIGLYQDATKTDVESDRTIYIDHPDYGLCKKTAEMKTGEMRRRRVDNSIEQKLVLEFVSDKGVIYHVVKWEDEIRYDTATRNGADFQVHRLLETDSVSVDNYNRLRSRLQAREEEIKEIVGSQRTAAIAWADTVGTIIKKTRPPMFIPPQQRRQSSTILESGGDGVE